MAQLRFAQAMLDASREKFAEEAVILKQVIEVQESVLGSAALRHLHWRKEAHEAGIRGALILKSSH